MSDGQILGMPRWVAIGGALASCAFLGTCVWGFSGLFKDAENARQKTLTFFEVYMFGGNLPLDGEGIYYQPTSWEDSTIERLNLFIERAGEVLSSEDTNCSVNSSANLNPEQSGTIAQCVTLHELAKSKAQSTLVWRKKGEDWLLQNLNYTLFNQEFANQILGDVALIQRGLDPDNLPDVPEDGSDN